MLPAIIAVLCGLALLVYGADRFVVGAVGIARGLGVPTLLIGLTIVGIATSMPEVLVGGVAAWDGKTNIAIGNALGSNIANIGLVLGGTALAAPLLIRSAVLRDEFLIMLLAMLVALLLLLDQHLSRLDGFLMLGALALLLGWVTLRAQRTPATAEAQAGEQTQASARLWRSALFMLLGLLVLLAGAELLVRGATHIARLIGVSDLVIGLTVIAVGTSLPELAASLMSVVKKETELALGNVIGSNMFNMLMVLGIPGIIHPDTFGREVLYRDFSMMAVLTLLMGILVFYPGKKQLDRREGALLLLCFVGYQYWLLQK